MSISTDSGNFKPAPETYGATSLILPLIALLLLLQGCQTIGSQATAGQKKISPQKQTTTTADAAIDKPEGIATPTVIQQIPEPTAVVMEPAKQPQQLPGNGKVQVFTHTVTQVLGGAQSPDDARSAAIRRAKREILEQAGTYLESITEIENGRLTKDEIIAMSAAIFKTEIISEERIVTAESFALKVTVRVEVDPAVLQERIQALSSDQEWRQKLKAASEREEELLEKIASLEARLQEMDVQETSSQDIVIIREEYQDLREELDDNWSWFSQPPPKPIRYRPPPPSFDNNGFRNSRRSSFNNRPPPPGLQNRDRRPSQRGFSNRNRLNPGRGGRPQRRR